MKTRLAVLSLCVLLLASVCGAQVRQGTVELNPFAGYLFGGTFARGTTALFNAAVDVDDHATYGGRIGYYITSLFQLEGQFSRTDTAFVSRSGNVLFGQNPGKLGDLTIDYWLGYTTYNFGHGRAVPYITLGLGAARLKPNVCNGVTTACQNPGQDTRFTASIGGGLKIFVNRNFGFRFDGRYYGTSLPSSRTFVCDSFSDTCTRHDWLSNGDVNGGLILAF